MKIQELFHRAAIRMQNDFEEAKSLVSHSATKGDVNEEIFRSFLRKYLSRSLDISTGFLVDSFGGVSDQLDVIISDAIKTPIFFSSGEDRIIPVECAYAVFEVKARLDTTELDKIFKNMESVRKLRKAAYHPGKGLFTTVDLYGRSWDIWPVNYYVFAFDSIDIYTLEREIGDRHRENQLPEHSRIDAVCVLNKGVVYNEHPDGTVSALPIPGSRVTGYETRQALLLFYSIISNYLFQTWMPDFRFKNYLGKMTFE